MKIFKMSSDVFAGVITGISGAYSGAIFRLDPDENITFGRDPRTSQIVLDEDCTLVSRTHCTIKGDITTGNYSVTDHSSNGTFVNGERMPKETVVTVPRGTIISLGDKNNSFKLN